MKSVPEDLKPLRPPTADNAVKCVARLVVVVPSGLTQFTVGGVIVYARSLWPRTK